MLELLLCAKFHAKAPGIHKLVRYCVPFGIHNLGIKYNVDEMCLTPQPLRARGLLLLRKTAWNDKGTWDLCPDSSEVKSSFCSSLAGCP